MKKYLLLLLLLAGCSKAEIAPRKYIIITKVKQLGTDGYFCEYTTRVQNIYGEPSKVKWHLRCGEYNIGDTIKICK